MPPANTMCYIAHGDKFLLFWGSKIFLTFHHKENLQYKHIKLILQLVLCVCRDRKNHHWNTISTPIFSTTYTLLTAVQNVFSPITLTECYGGYHHSISTLNYFIHTFKKKRKKKNQYNQHGATDHNFFFLYCILIINVN